MKATQLTPKEIEKIIYALELAYTDSENWDKLGVKVRDKLIEAKIVFTAK